jgi:hypothetical protein
MLRLALLSLFGFAWLLVGCVDSSPSPDAADGSGQGDEGPLTFSVDTSRRVHPISPLIYGVNPHSGARCDDADTGWTLCRLGGNRWTAYNWENNLSNAGRDWCYQNDEHLGSMDDPPGSAATDMVDTAAAAGVAAMLTVPIVDYVAGTPTSGSGPPECSGDVRDRGDDYLETLFKRNLPSSGSEPAVEPDTLDDFVYQDEFVATVRERADAARVIFSLDNEPELWDDTHPEVHPQRASYEEVVRRSVEYATVIRQTWPEAEVNGFAGGGLQAAMTLGDAPDADQYGDFVEYYLRGMRAAHEDAGLRLLDYLDVHWYPEVRVVDSSEQDGGTDGSGSRVTTADTFPEIVEARVQAPRSLWDSSYQEDSWLTFLTGGPIELLPRLQEKLDELYPGVQLAITEWHYGAGHHISGGIAHADVLGVFGREGVGLATLWPHQRNEAYVAAAYRVYRNYDGAGARFGDTSVRADCSDHRLAAVYASVDEGDDERVVIVAINRSVSEQSATIELEHSVELRTAAVYTLTAESPELQPARAPRIEQSDSFDYLMPGHSVSVIELTP